MFIRNITATVSRQYKELVTPIVRMFRKYFWDIIVMKKKNETTGSKFIGYGFSDGITVTFYHNTSKLLYSMFTIRLAF